MKKTIVGLFALAWLSVVGSVGAHRSLVPASVRVGVFALDPRTMPQGYRLTYQHYVEMYDYSQNFTVRGEESLSVHVETQASLPGDTSFCDRGGVVLWHPALLGDVSCGYMVGARYGITFSRANVYITVESSASSSDAAAWAHRLDRQVLRWLATH